MDHPRDDELLFNISQLLLKLIGKDYLKNPQIPVQIQQSGCLPALLSALAGFPDISKHTVKAIFELLELLAQTPALHKALIDLNVVESIFQAIKTLPLSPLTVKKGLETLRKLFESTKNGFRSGLVGGLLEILREKKTHAGIVESGLKLLDVVTRDPEVRNELQKEKGLEVVAMLMEKHGAERTVLALGAHILGKIANKEDLGDAVKKIRERGLFFD